MGVFDILPGFGGDGEATDAEPADDSGNSGGGAGDAVEPAALTPAEFRERADALTGRSDVPTLDFTVESLDALDELAAGPPGAVDRVAYGSYLGETLVREFGGEWVDEDGWHVAVEVPEDRTTIAVFDAAQMSIAKEPVFAKVAARLDAEGAERTPETSEDLSAEDLPAEDPADEENLTAEVATDDAPTEQVDTAEEDDDSEPLLETGDDEERDAEEGDGVDDESDGARFETDENEDEETDEGDDAAFETDEGGDDGKTDESNAGPGADTGPTDAESGDDEGASDTLYQTEVVEMDHQGTDEATAGDHSEAGPEGEAADAADARDGDAADADEHPSTDEADADDDAAPGDEADPSESEPTDVDSAGRELDEATPGETTGSEPDADEGAGDTPTETAADTDAEDDVDGSDAHREDAGDLPFSGPGTADEGVAEPDEEADDVAGKSDDPDGGSDGLDVGSESDGEADDDPVDSPSQSADTGREADGPGETEGPASDGDATADSPGDDHQVDDLSAADSPPADPAGEDSHDSRDTGSRGTDDAGGPAGDETAGEATDQPNSDAVDGSDESDVETETADADEADDGSLFDPTEADAGFGGTDSETRDSDGDDPADDEDDEPVAPDRDVVREAAEAVADGWPDWDLDFTPESLPRLDTFVDDQWDGRFRASSLAERSVDHEDETDPLTQLGAYYGEVLVRWLDGEWVATDDGDGAVAVPDVGEKTERVDVFTLARDCLVAPATFAYRYDALVNRLHVDKNVVSDGRPDVFDAGRESLTSGDVITQFAETAEAFAEQWEQYRLDYSPRSLRDLDEIVDALARDADCADVPLGEGSDPESLWLTARATATGAYFAAVLLRHRDAQWRIGTDVELVIDRPDGESTVDPVATAADCLRGEGSFTETYASLGE